MHGREPRTQKRQKELHNAMHHGEAGMGQVSASMVHVDVDDALTLWISAPRRHLRLMFFVASDRKVQSRTAIKFTPKKLGTDRGPRTEDQGPRTQYQGPSTEDNGPKTKDQANCQHPTNRTRTAGLMTNASAFRGFAEAHVSRTQNESYWLP